VVALRSATVKHCGGAREVKQIWPG
jgi:hypothetical protein